MADSEEQQLEEPVQVTFFPPLHLQRRIWVLDILRREKITSVLDIGCGEGQLLVVLAQPSLYLKPPNDRETTTPISPMDAYKDEYTNLHCARVSGLDISPVDLEFAVESTAPPPPDGRDVRWEPLEVNIWKGGLEAYNSEFVDVECIVSTEVCEHLPEDILADYAPMILGLYRPRLFLMTTPSYTFNARFTPPGTQDRTGYPDPTGRTTRYFRHHDHKFEWTVEEFTEWCRSAAEEWGYEVKVESVGRAQETDEWGRDAELGGASQTAEFRRLDDEISTGKRTTSSQHILERAMEKAKHELLATHNHLAHPQSRQPASLREIADAVKTKMVEFREVFLRVEELWFEREVSILCGGWLELLVQAVESDDRFDIYKGEMKSRLNWRVELKGDVHPEMESWQPESVGDVSIDPFESWDGSSVEESQSDTERGEGSEREKDDETKVGEVEKESINMGDNPWEAAISWGDDSAPGEDHNAWHSPDLQLEGQWEKNAGWGKEDEDDIIPA